jgi:hypothetical protein
MSLGAMAAVMAALAMLAGCVPAASEGGTAPPVSWRRPAHLDPWYSAGTSPTAHAIEIALYEDTYEIDLSECPFHLAACEWVRAPHSRGVRRTPHAELKVDEVQCSPVAEWQDRCTFRLTERIAGQAAVRSRCSGYFNVVGHSHMPSRWGVDYRWSGDDSQPAMVCKRGRTERRALW